MRSSKLSFFVLLILLSSSFLFAQTDSSGYNSQLQFHLVNGYSLSYLNSLSNSSALRYKLDFNLSVQKVNNDLSSSFPSSIGNYSYSSAGKSESNSQMLNFTTQYLWYPLNESLVRIFLGAGPFISLNRIFRYESADQTQNDGSKSYNSYEILQYSLGIGIGGTAGVECFVTKQLSLIGEYGISGSYSWGKRRYSNKYNSSPNQSVSENTNESNTNGWSIGLGNLRLGIAFRF
ncbi:MAG: hypothetical protein AB1298_01620 [Bacteroidota bacterium]